MDRSSIHLSASTRRRLSRYRERGMSFDAVLNIFMEGIEPGDFKRRWQVASRQAAKRTLAATGKRRFPVRDRIRPSASADPRSTLGAKRPLGTTSARSGLDRPLSPGSGMESAFRLFKLGRSNA